jgi:hypothetical protein
MPDPTTLGLELECKYLVARRHHEWPDVLSGIDRLCAKTATPDILRDWTLRQTWLAAVWSPDPNIEELLSVGTLRDDDMDFSRLLAFLAYELERGTEPARVFTAAAGVTPDEIRDWASALERGHRAIKTLPQMNGEQYGPFVWNENVVERTRRPTAATMLAAQLTWSWKKHGATADWKLVAKLLAVAGINGSIRISQ